MNNQIITRFAPSPTGLLHVGGLRTALYAYLFAKHNDGKFFLRIEDTDAARFVPGSEENIEDSLRQAGITWDNETPIRQSERLALYNERAQELIANKHAYYCFCTSERLEALRTEQQTNKLPTRYDGHCRELNNDEVTQRLANGEAHVIRLAMPHDGTATFDDVIRGEVTFANNQIDDQVLIKSDSFPTYHLASVVDDHDMNISHVIRGEEWLSSTPKHLFLYQAFGWEPPTFAHLPLLLNADKSKLSKRQGDVSVKDYLDRGYLIEALLNFVLFLGWNPGTDQELFSLADMIKQFDLAKVHKAGAVFDLEKLNWLNSQYIRKLSVDELVAKCRPYYAAAGITAPDEQLKKIIASEQERIKTLDEIVESTAFYFQLSEYDVTLLPWKKNSTEQTRAALVFAQTTLEQFADEPWTEAELEPRFLEAMERDGKAKGDILWPLRVALSGLRASPGPFAILAALGKAEALRRIALALEKLS
jgi:glutamyl-tRNA synthetase